MIICRRPGIGQPPLLLSGLIRVQFLDCSWICSARRPQCFYACHGNLRNMLSLSLCVTYPETSWPFKRGPLHVVLRSTSLVQLHALCCPRLQWDSRELQTGNALNASSPEPTEWDISPQMLPPSQTWFSQSRMTRLLPYPRNLRMFRVPFSRHWSVADPDSDIKRMTFHYLVKT